MFRFKHSYYFSNFCEHGLEPRLEIAQITALRALGEACLAAASARFRDRKVVSFASAMQETLCYLFVYKGGRTLKLRLTKN